MAYLLPFSLNKLIQELARLPGVGPKSAQRLAFHLLLADKKQADSLAQAIIEARAKITACTICGNISDTPVCTICNDSQRNPALLCVVEKARDIIAIERSLSYNGLYHVLNGAISPMDGIGPDKLRIAELFERLDRNPVKEVIIATNPDVEGEATALYLAKKLRPLITTVSRIAHGLPVGGDLEYADEATLTLALNDRKEI